MYASGGGLVTEAVLRIGGITLHESAAYAAILAVLAVALGFVSKIAARRTQREAWQTMRRLLRRH